MPGLFHSISFYLRYWLYCYLCKEYTHLQVNYLRYTSKNYQSIYFSNTIDWWNHLSIVVDSHKSIGFHRSTKKLRHWYYKMARSTNAQIFKMTVGNWAYFSISSHWFWWASYEIAKFSGLGHDYNSPNQSNQDRRRGSLQGWCIYNFCSTVYNQITLDDSKAES